MPPFVFVALAYCALSLITAAVFGKDKRAAIKGQRRTPERTLHWLSLVGGWPGALIAMQLFRHKRRKRPFVWTVRFISAVHLAAWICWAIGAG
ncbi:MAG: uncharacterized membrane protein YsdA (DUF1294 family) [Bradymonadia bacterium]|jgi:uncharacterized membrane protein YsdA (DUF1294 family)